MVDGNEWYGVLLDTDVCTAQLIVKLQLADLEEAARLSVVGTERPLDKTATELQRSELTHCRTRLPDRKLAEDLEETENDIQEALESAAFGWSFKVDDNLVVNAPPEIKYVSCVSCEDRALETKAVKVPCDHVYCSPCLNQLYESSMTDETLYPPRCCHRDFPWELVRRALTQQLRSRFGARRVELDTKDRTYCHQNGCSAFIKPATIFNNIAPCPKCRSSTCSTCKNAWHLGTCPRDEALDVLMQTADLNEWQRCSACRRVIELKTGCNHIT